MSCFCDYEPASFYRAAKPKARKAHKCFECGATIEPGEKYEKVTGLWDGIFDTYKTCHRCFDLRTWVKNNVPCFCWGHGNMIEDAEETIKEATWRAPDETRGLWFGFLRRKVACGWYKSTARKGHRRDA